MKTFSKQTGRTLLAWLLSCSCLLAVEAADPVVRTARELVQEGSQEFMAGKIAESIRSFESAIKLRPSIKAHLWQLGISYYYAGRFAEGRDLFELHQTVNSEDVENAVWHFLCVAKLEGVEMARQKLIAISGDARVPMKQVHALFSGAGTAEAVLEAAAAAPARTNALCYARLYLGLFEEARGNPAASAEHISKAANDYRQAHYMGRVAQVHARLRAKKQE